MQSSPFVVPKDVLPFYLSVSVVPQCQFCSNVEGNVDISQAPKKTSDVRDTHGTKEFVVEIDVDIWTQVVVMHSPR